jgi:spore coat-associated protein N
MEKTSTRRRRSLMVLAVAGLAVVSMSAGAASLAQFTSTAAAATNTFSAGSVVIGTTPTSTLVSFANMAPGDVVTAPITVSNTGTLALRYALSSVSTNTDTKGLKDQLVLSIKSGVTTCTNAAFAATGTSVYTGDLDSTAGKLAGDSATGSQAGDRNLAASTNEILCFNVSLPLATGNAFQGAATTATFTFDAEQTANNP